MTISLHIVSWYIPLSITIIGVFIFGMALKLDSKEGSWGQGLATVFVGLSVIPSIILSWIVWGLTLLLK